jgi:hypothetical protein
LESNVVIKDKGVTSITDLRIGDMVLSDNHGTYSRFYSKGHYKVEGTTEFLRISTESTNKPLELTPGHMVFKSTSKLPVPAHSIKVGDALKTVNGPSKVTSISKVSRNGLFNPLTISGSIVVDGIVSSAYCEEPGFEGMDAGWLYLYGFKVIHWHVWSHHWVNAPHRIICGKTITCNETLNEDGMIPYHQFLYDALYAVEKARGECPFLAFLAAASFTSLLVSICSFFLALELVIENFTLLASICFFMLGSWIIFKKAGALIVKVNKVKVA